MWNLRCPAPVGRLASVPANPPVWWFLRCTDERHRFHFVAQMCGTGRRFTDSRNDFLGHYWSDRCHCWREGWGRCTRNIRRQFEVIVGLFNNPGKID